MTSQNEKEPKSNIADLSIKLSENKRINRIQDIPLQIGLPQSMTKSERVNYVLLFSTTIILGSVFSVWLGFQLFEETILKFLPLVIFSTFMKFLAPHIFVFFKNKISKKS